jgi:type I restriction enzyme S subunit
MGSESKFKETEIGRIPADWEIGIFNKDLKVKGRIGWKGYKTTDLRDEGPIVIGGTNIKSNFYLDLTEIKHISREKFEESPEIVLKKGDVLLVQRGNNSGDIAYFDGAIEEATINPSVIILSEFTGDSKFLFYYLISPIGKNNILSTISGSSIPAIYQSDVLKLKYPRPSIQEQEKISYFLLVLDDKIALNRLMNSTLEAIGQALFNRWFVDFEFPDEEGKPYRSSGGEMVETELGEVPRGWRIMIVGEVLELAYGKTT